MADANPSPAFAAPGNPDKFILGGDNNPTPPPFAAPGNGSGKMPSAAGDPMGTPRCCPGQPDPGQVKAMFSGS